MKHFFRNRKNIIISCILFVVCISFLFIHRPYIGVLPFCDFYFEDISDISYSQDGRIYLLNNSGTYFYRINPDNEIDLIMEGNSDLPFLFRRGLQVCSDCEGNFYVHNRIASPSVASAIGEEKILVYNKYGLYTGYCYDTVHDEAIFRPEVIELQCIDNSVFAIIAKENEVILKDLSCGSETVYELSNANLLVNEATYNPADKSIYAILRNGSIVKSTDSDFETLYVIPDANEEIILSDICICQNGNIYVSDIGNMCLYQFINHDLNPVCTYDDPPYKVLSDISEDTILADSTYSLLYTTGSEYQIVESAKPSAFANILIILCWLGLLVSALCLLYLIIAILIRVFVVSSSRIKTIGTFGVFSLLLTIVFCLIMKDGIVENIVKTELDTDVQIASILNDLIEPEDFLSLRSCDDFCSDSYNRIHKACESVIMMKSSEVNNRYSIMYTLEKDDSVYVRYSTEQNYGCNYPYIWSDGTDERRLYTTGQYEIYTEPATDPTGTFLDIYYPMKNDEGEVIGIIEVGSDYTELISSSYDLIFTIGMSLFALMVVILLIVLEIIEFKEAQKIQVADLATSGRKQVPLKMLRMIVFLVFFVTNLTTPFLSIYALELSDKYSNSTFFSPEILAAIPLSAEVFFGALTSIFGNRIIRKINYRKSAFLGAIMFIGGLLIRCVYPDLWVLTLGNSVMGAGWGILLLIVNATIAAEEDEAIQENGFTDYNIALQNGMNSGVVAGGFLLMFLTHRGVLMISTVISLVMLVFVNKYIFDGDISVTKIKTGIKDTVKFIFTPKVLLYFFCIVVPVIAASYYLIFLYPILGTQLGMSETFIGYSYLANALITIVFSNVIVRFVTKHFSDKVALVLASLLYLITFVMVGVFTNIPIMLAALIILPVSDSFGYVIQETYFSKMKETEALGYDKAMGVYSLFENLSQAVGSILFGYVLIVGVTKGMVVFGLVIGALALLFLLLGRGRKS